MHGNLPEVFPALGFATYFRKICKNISLRVLVILPKIILLNINYNELIIYVFIINFIINFLKISLFPIAATFYFYKSFWSVRGSQAPETPQLNFRVWNGRKSYWTQPGSAPKPPRPSPEPSSKPSPEPSLNLTRRLHQCTPELFWAEDPISLCCWGI